MKLRVSFLRRLLSKALPRRVPQKPARPGKPARSRHVGIEPLEGRIAPATLVSGNVIFFNDLDGDLVTVTFSKSLFDPVKTIAENKLNDIFKFSNGTTAVSFETTGPQQLQLIDLTKVQTVAVNGVQVNPASGTSLAVKATKGTGDLGDDATNVGTIRASGLTLDTVRVEGDLGQIDIGTAASKVALRSLVVDTLGKFGTATQVTGTTATDALESRITGKVRSVMVNGDLSGYLHAIDGTSIVNSQPTTTAPAKIGSVTVAGSLRGNPTAGVASNNTGAIESAGSIGTVSVLTLGNDVGLVGGGGLHSGSIIGKTIGSVVVKGALLGGGGSASGSVIASGDLASVAVGSLVTVNLPPAPPATQAVGGLKGGGGANSGSVQAGGALGTAAILGGIAGGTADGSGVLSSAGTMGAVTVNGDITGLGVNSGGVSAGGDLASLIITGKLVGGATAHSGFVDAFKDAALVKFSSDVTGGAGANSGSIAVSGDLARAIIGGKLTGGAGANSGSIFAASDPFTTGTLTFVKVKGGTAGGGEVNSGSIVSEGTIGTAVIGTSILAANLTGGTGNFSGSIFASGSIGTVTVKGSVVGGVGENSGSIQATDLIGGVAISGGLAGGGGESSGGVTSGGSLGALTVGAGITNAAVRVGDELTTATITGDVSGTTISARGAALPGEIDLAIGTITISGNVSTSRLLAGYDVNGATVNADASVGLVKVSGNWTASDLVAGVQDISSNGFGNIDDVKIAGGTDKAGRTSQIAAIVVKGTVNGTAVADDDHYGFVAQQILAFKQGATKLALNAAVPLQTFELGPNTDVTVREVA